MDNTGTFRLYIPSSSVGTGVFINVAPTSGDFKLFSTTDSVSSSTGALQVQGGVGISKSLFVAGTVTVPSPINATDAATKAYVDTKQSVITAGTGLTLTGSTLSVNAAQTQITSLGTLSSLSVSGTVTVPTQVNNTDAANKA